MKKLMCAVAAVAAGVAFAEDLVQAPEIVGYMTGDLKFQSAASEEFTMMSVPFRGIENEYVPMSDIKFTNLIKGHDYLNECDYIQVWNEAEGALQSFYFCEEEDCWYFWDGNQTMDEYYPNGLLVGTPFWFVAYTKGTRPLGDDVAPTLTVSGAVKKESFRAYNNINYISTASEEFTMISNPFPVAWMPGTDTCEISNIIKGHDFLENCDYLQIWLNGQLESYYFCEEEDCWYFWDGNYTMEEMNPNGIPAGAPFWFVAYTKATRPDSTKGPTITFYNPIAE